MSERGVFAIDRGLFDHDCFDDEPFTQREAWVWLIGAAAWKAKTVRVGKFVANLDRGQGAFSVRFLASKWQWSKSRVDRFLERLKNRDMIETQSGTGINVITINNYNQYQRVSLPDRDSSGTQTGTAAGQQRDKEEDIKHIEKNAAPVGAHPADLEKELFARGKQVLGKGSGGMIANLLKAKGGKPELARSVIEMAATKQNPREYVARVTTGPPGQSNEGWRSGIAGVL